MFSNDPIRCSATTRLASRRTKGFIGGPTKPKGLHDALVFDWDKDADPSTLYVPYGAKNRAVITLSCVGSSCASIGVQQELGDKPV
jgi:hypothetical protein